MGMALEEFSLDAKSPSIESSAYQPGNAHWAVTVSPEPNPV
jgi:hypothetical protein